MGKRVIAIDIDDVLAANAAGFVAYSNKRWGTNLTVEDYKEHWGELWQVGHDEAERRALEIHDARIVADYDYDDQALPVLLELKRRFSLMVVTSRRQLVKDLTLDWIERHYEGVFDDVVFAGLFDAGHSDFAYARTKLETLQRIEADYMIDDHPKHCLSAAGAGIKSIMFGDYGWNRLDALPSNVTRCPDWQTVAEYFRNQW